MTSDQQSRLLEMFAACLLPTASKAEHQELQDVLRADAEARSLWFLHQDLELGLKCLTQIPIDSGEHARERGGTQTDVVGATGVPLPVRDNNSARRASGSRSMMAMTAVVVASLSAMVAMGVHLWDRSSDSSRNVGSTFATNRTRDLVVESPTDGTTFTLSDQKAKLIALHFLLKSECPFCLKLTHDYGQLSKLSPDVVHLFLKPDSPDEIKIWAAKISQEGLENPPVIYRDPDARLAKEFGIPDGYEFHGQTVHYPALVLLDRSGQELFRYVGKNNSDRMMPDAFHSVVATVTQHQ
ncbi:TlpA family protein disulfide reductase [Schlesneria paludicola]|uniref:TlpA family protein disulfide reductase n=1 Tax=Schlesneria paludicola TaxID=360056 RepID=UPI00029B2F34|nr:redoxin domain-containing protein [Schlesneria paludicola]